MTLARISVPILMYHSIANVAPKGHQINTVAPDIFGDHMRYISEKGYTTITVKRFVECIQSNARLPKRPVVITFDDGYLDFYINALPILQKFDLTATLYTTTAFVGGKSLWLHKKSEDCLPMLSWSQLSEIDRLGIENGSHGCSHSQLDALPLAAAIHEIVYSKCVMEDKLGHEVSSFCYPYGYYNTAVRQVVQETGYTSACAVKFAMSSPQDDVFALARLHVTNKTTVTDLSAMLRGIGTPPAPPPVKWRSRIRSCIRRGVGRLTHRCRFMFT